MNGLPLPPVDALRRDVAVALDQLRKRLAVIEADIAALAPLRDSDRLEVARVCQAAGIPLKEIDRRDASDGRARKISRVLLALRQKGWSLDRIARATGYSARGVASNLERFSQAAVTET